MTRPIASHSSVPAAMVRGSADQRLPVETDPLRSLRIAIYVYFLLWLFEGALRKWILPGLSSPLLIIRDPVLLFIYFEAVRQKIFRVNGLVLFLLILGTLSIVVSMGLFHPPPIVVLGFGIHSNFLHLPLIFLIPQIISYTEVRKMGRIILWVAPFMAVLVALQFLSPSGSRLNTGAGGEGKMLETALDRIRPSGTFSFTNGLAEYTVFLTAFLFHHLLEKNIFKKITFLLAAPSLLILVVMSGSRTVFALVGLEVLAMMLIWFLKPRFLQSSIKLVAIAVAVVFVIGSVGALKLGMDVIITRFTTSGGMKEGFLIRILDEFKKPLNAASRAEPAGVGIGMGTNAASNILSIRAFTLGESESDRIVMEMGPYLGLPYLLWRFAVLVVIARFALKALRTRSNTLPLFLATACANDLVMGQFGQTTVIGFAVLSSGFALAALQRRDDEGLTSSDGFDTAPALLETSAPSSDTPVALAPPIVRYADLLRAEAERIAAEENSVVPLSIEKKTTPTSTQAKTPLKSPRKKKTSASP